MVSLTPELKAELNKNPHFDKVSDESGILIVRVFSGSPADDVGLLVGDVIHKISGKTVTTPQQVQQIIRDSEVGEKQQFQISRNGTSLYFTVSSAEFPASDSSE